MKKYIGVKIVEAEPCAAWQQFGEWGIGADGYKVRYSDGYESWCPKGVFEAANRPIDGMTFGTAVEAMKQGKKVARVGWNGNGMFAYYVPANAYPVHTDAAKSFFGEESLVPYRHYLALKTAQGDVATWAPSCSDALAEDWRIVDDVNNGRRLI